MSCEVINGKRTYLIGANTLEDLPDLKDTLKKFRYQHNIVLGDLNNNIQNQNPRSQQVAELLMEFGLADFRHHIDRAGDSNIRNVVSEAGQKIFVRKVGRRRRGGKKGRDEGYRELRPAG